VKPDDAFETNYFRYVRGLNGELISIGVARHNGRLVPQFHPSITDRETNSGSTESPNTQRDRAWTDEDKYYINLNATERQTWRKILSAQSIASIAKDEGVSRAAIYSRIQGNSKGQGGMIGKNFWVLLWWRLRQSFLSQSQYD
jgi:hypothetical protein